jgi:type IV secretion system protein VirD4
VQIPQEVLQVTPSLARVLIGGLLDAVLAQAGRVVGRVGFFIDEAVLLGPEPSLKLARDQGRKSKVTLQLFYQSEGQIEDVWGKAQKDAWFDGVSFRSYTRVQNVNTAKDLVTALGTYGAKAESRSNSAGSSGRPLEWASRQKGDSAQESELARELMKPHELLQELRANERITIVANDRPIRHVSAIDFCRPEIAARLGQTDYQARFAGEDLEEAA